MLAEAKKAIQHCEKSLRALMSEASAAGRYDEVDVLMDLARQLHKLTEDKTANSSDTPKTPPKTGAKGKHSVTKQRGSNTRSSAYPIFVRSHGELVKIGWSKKEKKEYQHRAPWEVVELLCKTLKGCGHDEFTSEDILPLVGADGTETPSYQSYLCLAWMRESGLIIKDGRKGYYVPSETNLNEDSMKAWKKLPQKR